MVVRGRRKERERDGEAGEDLVYNPISLLLLACVVANEGGDEQIEREQGGSEVCMEETRSVEDCSFEVLRPGFSVWKLSHAVRFGRELRRFRTRILRSILVPVLFFTNHMGPS